MYVVRVMRGKGIYNKSDYITFLQLMEAIGNITSTTNGDSDDQQKISADELKEALVYAKNAKHDKTLAKNTYFRDGGTKKLSTNLSDRSRRTVMLFHASQPQVGSYFLFTRLFTHSYSLAQLALQKSISSYFLFSRPHWYFNIIDGLIMPIAFYGSLWFCNFCSWAYQSTESSMFMAISFVPFILCIIMIVYIIRSAALLRLVTSLDSDKLQEAIENTEISTELADNLRSKILTRLKEIGTDVEIQLKYLFQQIDEDGSELLSRSEFQDFLGKCNHAVT